jgi:hypothetical protein
MVGPSGDSKNLLTSPGVHLAISSGLGKRDSVRIFKSFVLSSSNFCGFANTGFIF